MKDVSSLSYLSCKWKIRICSNTSTNLNPTMFSCEGLWDGYSVYYGYMILNCQRKERDYVDCTIEYFE